MDINDSSVCVKVAIAGAAGRMGRRLCAMAAKTDGVELAEAFDRPGHPDIGKPAADGADNVLITDSFEGKADVLIDFTTPQATRELLANCV